MRCRGCDSENRDGAAFCSSCGHSLAATACPSCETLQPTAAQFCDACGQPLTREDPPPSPPAAPGGSVAERRLVTVLFADAQGSTALTERLGDEEMYRLMQGCVGHMQAAVDSHGGTVTQFRGDGVMALFGAPLAIENAAVQGVTAALVMQDLLGAYAQEVRERTGAECPFRIGVNSGPVVVGSVGGDTLVDYTAIGDTANVAARLEQAAGPREVFISEATHRAVRDYVECEPLGPLDVKGKSEPLVAYRAVRRLAVRDRLDATAHRGLSPYVGRDHELALLTGFVERLGDGHGRVVALSGEAGIGKSRLMHELSERLPAEVDWFEGRSSASTSDAPWHVIIDLFRRAFDLAEADSHADISERVDERSRSWSDDAAASSQYVKWLLGVPVPELDVDPQVRRAHIFESLVTVMTDAASRRPVVLLFEDLHWADEASAAAIVRMAQAVADLPVLLLLTYRPEQSPELGELPWITRLALDGLVSDAAADLAASGSRTPLSVNARQLIVDRTGGNPLFVEELTASLLEAGVLREIGDVVDLVAAPDDSNIPDSLQEVVLARIDRLELDARQALQLAAVIGRGFTHRILDRISQMPDTLDDRLAELEALELIRQQSVMPEVAYLFKHAIVHDVTYSTLLDERRRALHRTVALAIEELYPDTIASHCEELARHWLAASDEACALPHLIEAGRRAVDAYSVKRAISAFNKAAEIAERLDDLVTTLELRLGSTRSFLAMSDIPGAIEASFKALNLARLLGDVPAQATAVALRAAAEFQAHEFDTSVSSAREAQELTQGAPVGEVADAMVFALTAEAFVHSVLGRNRTVDEILERIEPYVAAHLSADATGWLAGLKMLRRSWQADYDLDPGVLELADAYVLDHSQTLWWAAALNAAALGRFEEALSWLHRALDLSTRSDELIIQVRVLNTIGWIHGDLGDHHGAVEWNHRSLALAAQLELPDREVDSNARLNLAELSLVHGHIDETADQLDIVSDVVRNPTPADRWMLWRYSLRWLCLSGELALARDHAERAVGFADECMPRAIETNSPKYILWARRLRSRGLAKHGHDDEAEVEMTQALQEARALRSPTQLWRTLIDAAELGGLDAAQHAGEALAAIDTVIADLTPHALAESLRASPERARAAALASGG